MNILINPYQSQTQYSKQQKRNTDNVSFESRLGVNPRRTMVHRWLEKFTDYGLWPGSSRGRVIILTDYGLKITPELKLTAHQKELFAKAAAELGDMKNMNLLAYDAAWGSCISPASNSNLLLHVMYDDLVKMTDSLTTLSRLLGAGGVFELSILGTDKKALISVPAEELTQNMTVIDKGMQAGIHPFLVDMTKFLDSHPEIVQEIESYAGHIDLSNVDSDILKKLGTCLINYKF